MKVSDFLIKRLEEKGIKEIFLVPGGGAMHLNDALARSKKISAVPCHSEQACGIAAEAYGRCGTKGADFGVIMVTTGPGSTNTLTAVVGAWIESLPLLVIAGQAKTSDITIDDNVRQKGVQGVDIKTMVSGHVKFFGSIRTADEAKIKIEEALNKMNEGRKGPVWIEIPLDVQAATITDLSVNEAKQDLTTSNSKYKMGLESEDYFEKIIGDLKRCERPILLVGHGVRLSKAQDKAIEVARRLGIPICTTWNAIDIIEYDDHLCLGRPGVVGLRTANISIQNCDLLISVGSRLDNIVCSYNLHGFARSASKYICDIDSEELKKFRKLPNTCVACLDAGLFFDTLLEKVNSFKCKTENWIKECNDNKRRFSAEIEYISAINENKKGSMSHYHAVMQLSKVFPENLAIVTGSSGMAIEIFYTAFANKKGQRIFLTSGLGSMGYGLPAGIGTAVRRRNENVICIESDGSLMMNLQELATWAEHASNLRMVLFDNDGYASIRNTQAGYFSGRYIAAGQDSGLRMPDMTKVFSAFGIESKTIHSALDITDDMINKWWLEGSIPRVLVLKCWQLEKLYPKVGAYITETGQVCSMPMEDMQPLLEIEELEKVLNGYVSELSRTARMKGN